MKGYLLKSDDVKRTASGHWQVILSQLIPGLILSHKKHQPCPCCGGTDRFRLFADWEASGSGICNGCGHFDGFELIQRLLGCGFREAVLAVGNLLGMTASPRQSLSLLPALRHTPPRDAARQAEQHDRQRARLQALLTRTMPLPESDPALAYLRHRGLGDLIQHNDLPTGWRAVPDLPYWEPDAAGRMVRLTTMPALVAPVHDQHGQLVAAHRTWITPEGDKAALPHPRKLTTPIGDAGVTGSAIRLYPLTGDTLGLTEGIETALAIRTGFGDEMPVWACISANGLRSVQLPANARKVYILGDKDRSGTGQAAASELSSRLIQEGRTVYLCLPPGEIPYGTRSIDWLDILNGIGTGTTDAEVLA